MVVLFFGDESTLDLLQSCSDRWCCTMPFSHKTKITHVDEADKGQAEEHIWPPDSE
jgi:hypothetical protein